MKSSGKLGKIFLGCEVANISPFGVWVLVSGNEYFLDHKKFPLLKGASVEDVLNVESPRVGHLRWPALDVDLHLQSISSPEQLPLVARIKGHNQKAMRRTKRPLFASAVLFVVVCIAGPVAYAADGRADALRDLKEGNPKVASYGTEVCVLAFGVEEEDRSLLTGLPPGASYCGCVQEDQQEKARYVSVYNRTILEYIKKRQVNKPIVPGLVPGTS